MWLRLVLQEPGCHCVDQRAQTLVRLFCPLHPQELYSREGGGGGITAGNGNHGSGCYRVMDDSDPGVTFCDSLFQFNAQQRHMLVESDIDVNHRPFHHKARLHLRHLVSHHQHQGPHNGNGNHGNGKLNGDGKPRKNVSFADVEVLASKLKFRFEI